MSGEIKKKNRFTWYFEASNAAQKYWSIAFIWIATHYGFIDMVKYNNPKKMLNLVREGYMILFNVWKIMVPLQRSETAHGIWI